MFFNDMPKQKRTWSTWKPLRERLEAKIEKIPEGGCWIWTGLCCNGYGSISENSKNLAVHRVAYEIYVGVIPDGMHVCHRCDNPSCCNPHHLFIGSNADNVADKMAKGRYRNGKENKIFCKNGHPLSGNNLRVKSNGHRECKRCDADRKLKNYKLRKGIEL